MAYSVLAALIVLSLLTGVATTIGGVGHGAYAEVAARGMAGVIIDSWPFEGSATLPEPLCR